MTKTLFRVICSNAAGARSNSAPENGLEDGVLYDVVADVHAATTGRKPDGTASGYLVRNSDTGKVLAQLYRRDRFVREDQANATTSDGNSYAHERASETAYAAAPSSSQPAGDIEVGDTVICVDAVGARSFSKPQTMLEQDEEYVITADVSDATTVRKPDGGSSGYMVQRADDGAYLAGVFRRSRFEKASA